MTRQGRSSEPRWPGLSRNLYWASDLMADVINKQSVGWLPRQMHYEHNECWVISLKWKKQISTSLTEYVSLSVVPWIGDDESFSVPDPH